MRGWDNVLIIKNKDRDIFCVRILYDYRIVFCPDRLSSISC